MWRVLITISTVNNDFHRTHDIFDLFKDLAVKNLDTVIEVPGASTADAESNGQPELNGHGPEKPNGTTVNQTQTNGVSA